MHIMNRQPPGCLPASGPSAPDMLHGVSQWQQGALWGATAGVTAMLTCFPLDVVRTRIMSAPIGSTPAPLTLMRSIAQTEVMPLRHACLVKPAAP